MWVDRSGQSDKVPLPPRSYLHPRISPDGRKLAVEIEGSHHDIYVYDFTNSVLSNITNDGVSHWPIWSPDGQDIGYRSGPMGRFQLWQVRADRSRPPELVPAAGVSQSAESYSPDGRTIAYTPPLRACRRRSRSFRCRATEHHDRSTAPATQKGRQNSRRMGGGWRACSTNRESPRCTCRRFRDRVPNPGLERWRH